MSELQKNVYYVQNIIHNPKISFTINDRMFTGSARTVEQDKRVWINWWSFKIDEYKIWLEGWLDCRTNISSKSYPNTSEHYREHWPIHNHMWCDCAHRIIIEICLSLPAAWIFIQQQTIQINELSNLKRDKQ